MAKPVDAEVGPGHYWTLTDADLLATYRDALRGKETDHARRIETPGDYGPHFEETIKKLEQDIVNLRGRVVEYEEKVAAAEPEAPVVPDVVEDEATPEEEVTPVDA